MYFNQVKFRGDNFSYVIADEITKEAIVVDSSYNVDMLIRILNGGGFKLKYIVNTHGHPDHTSGNESLRSVFEAKTLAHKHSHLKPDLTVNDDDALNFGSLEIKVIYTPGHSRDSICLLFDGRTLLTGDTLFVGECGRTDLPGGDPRSLYDSLFNKLMKLEDYVAVYPGHDYGTKRFSTIGEERRSNYVLQPRSLDEFLAFMGES